MARPTEQRRAPRRRTKAGPQGAARGGGRRLAEPTSFWPEGEAPSFQWNPLRWNWRRAMVRLWLLASIIWGAYWLYNLQLACAFWFAPWCDAPAHVDWPNGNMMLGLAMVLLSGSILMLLGWIVISWVVRGLLARRER